MKQEWMKVVAQTSLAPRIYELILAGDLVKEMKNPGQFLHIKVPRSDLLLRRPISLASIEPEKNQCTIIYRIEGDGTNEMSLLRAGDQLDVMGPLGNGFPVEDVTPEDKVLIIGGGIGVPPLYELSNQVARKGAKVIHLFGFAQKEVMFYLDKFNENGEVEVATDDGSYGTHGHVGTLLEKRITEIKPTAVYACGSNGLLKTVEHHFADHSRAYMSLEARMACGMGACYACVCHLQEDTSKSKKICDEGPVFPTGEVVL